MPVLVLGSRHAALTPPEGSESPPAAAEERRDQNGCSDVLRQAPIPTLKPYCVLSLQMAKEPDMI